MKFGSAVKADVRQPASMEAALEEPLVEATLVAAVEAHRTFALADPIWRIVSLLLQAAEAWAEEIRMLTRVREGAMPAARGIAPLVKAESVPHKMQADQADLLGLDQATTAMRVNSAWVEVVPLTLATTSAPAAAVAVATTVVAVAEVTALLQAH